MKKICGALVSCFLFSTSTQATTISLNQTPPPASSGWHYEIAPYMWASAIKGQVVVDGHRADATIPFHKIWSDLQFAIQGHLEASNGPWALMLDPTYVKLSQNLPLDSHLTTEMTLVDAGVFYRLFSVQMKYLQALSLELLAGGRYFSLDNTLNLPIGQPVIDNTQVIAPIVGGRVKYRLNKLQLWARGDVGGFHINRVDRTWSWTTGIGYAITHCADIGIAYRVLQIDYNGGRNSQVNTRLYGPMIGFDIHD